MSELPYEGNIQKARQAGDRPAIRAIMEWNMAHPVVEVRQEEQEIPEQARSCKNSEDYISHDRWSVDYLPTITIRYMNFNEEIGPPICYRKEDLLHMLDNDVLHAWVIPYNNPELFLDEDGKVRSPYNILFKGYGEPSVVEKFVRVPLEYYLERKSLKRSLEDPYYVSLIAIPMYKTRLGNPEGSYGASRSHGQSPDVTVYWIEDFDTFKDIPGLVYEQMYNDVYYIKTAIILPLNDEERVTTLSMINQLQRDFPVASKDRNTYNSILPLQQYKSGQLHLRLPQIDDIRERNIISAMIEWVHDQPDPIYGDFFGTTYKKYTEDYVFEFKPGDFFHTADFVHRNAPMKDSFTRLNSITEFLYKFVNFPPVYFRNMPLYHETIKNQPSSSLIGVWLAIFNDCFNTGLSLLLNVDKIINRDNEAIIVGSIFDTQRLLDSRYYITSWMNWPDSIPIHTVINYILSNHIVEYNIYVRYYLENYSNFTIIAVYNMFYILYLLAAHWQIDDVILIKSDSDEFTSNNLISLIFNYRESELIMHIMKQPSLHTILTLFHTGDFKVSISDHITIRMHEIEQHQTIRFRDRFTYEGVTELDGSYQRPPGIGPNELIMMFYTDPDFHNLIGDYEFGLDQEIYLNDMLRVTYKKHNAKWIPLNYYLMSH